LIGANEDKPRQGHQISTEYVDLSKMGISLMHLLLF